MHIVSASRRTDIPHYYAKWFRARRKAGFAEYRTVFGGGPAGFFRASLEPAEVLGYLFWTKYSGPFQAELKALRKEKVPYVFQYTITGYGKDIESGIPARAAVIKDFIKVAKSLPAPECIQWRYDPILISTKVYTHAWHRKNFKEIAASLAGHTRVVNVSFTEPYQKAIDKVPEGHEIAWRQTNKQREAIYKKYPNLRAVGEQEITLLHELEAIAKAYGIQLHVCCNSEYTDKFTPAQCCGAELFEPYGPVINWQIAAFPAGPSRESCRCVKTVDIGMDNTCPGGCFYCYVTTSQDLAAENYKKHDPKASHLR
ncbi:MAG: DUF1848 family protein [Elusimicrobiota bacterium]|nr:DUF1848 family protein [Elusimicrobiota bacterium]